MTKREGGDKTEIVSLSCFKLFFLLQDLRWQLMSLVHSVVRQVTSIPPCGRTIRVVHAEGWTSSSRRGPCPLVAPPGRAPTEEERKEYEQSMAIMMKVIEAHKNKPYIRKHTAPSEPVPPSQRPASPPRSARNTALFSSLAGIAVKVEKMRERSRSPSRGRATSPLSASEAAQKHDETFADADPSERAEATGKIGAQAQQCEEDGPEEKTAAPGAQSPPRRRVQQSNTRLRVPWVQALRDMIRSKTKTSAD